LGNRVADAQSASSGVPTTGSSSDTSATPAVPADSSDSSDTQNPPNLLAPDNSQSPSSTQSPNVPLLPQQGGNPNSPFSVNSTNPQSSQITAPTLYLTGSNDLSQIATNAGLAQAFTQQPGASGFYSEEGVDYEHGPIERIRLGPFDLKTALLFSVISDDDLRTNTTTTGTGGGKVGDTSFVLTPAILLQYGTHEGQRGYVSLIYSPTLTRFYHHSDQDSDDQNVTLNAQYPFQRLTLDLTQTYTETTGVNTDSNTRTSQTASLTSIGGSYDISDKLSFASHLQEAITSFSGVGSQAGTGAGNTGGQGDTNTSINNSLSYRLSEKITLGPNFNVGWDDPQGEPKSTFEQASLGGTYAPTEKIALYAQGGVQFQQYDQGGGDATNPIFSCGATYTPFDSTALSVSASQGIHTSTAEIGQQGAGQTVVTTGINATLTQRIAQRFFFNFGFSYDHNENQAGSGNSSTLGNSSSSTQDTFGYRPSFTFTPNLWSSVAIYYQYQSNESSIPGSTYYDNQAGISLSVQF